MSEMEKEMQAFVEYVRKEFFDRPPDDPDRLRTALVRVGRPHLAHPRPASK
jgi:hypothetical protein